MEKRLLLSEKLLTKDGLIFISIDEHEYARLKLLCDDIFNNFIGTFCKKISGGKNDSKTIKINHEYLLCYGKSKESKIKLKEEITKKDTTVTLQKWGDTEERHNRENLWYPIYANLKTKKISFEQEQNMIAIYPIKNDGTERYWRWERKTAIKDIDKLRLTETKDDSGKIKYDIHVFSPKGIKKELPHSSFIVDFSAGGGTQLKDTMNEKIPKMYPKNLNYIKWICSLSIKENPIILDFFAGTGTTGHAIMDLLNDKDSNLTNDSKYILITNNENNICESVCYERLKRANEKYNYNSNLEYLKLQTLKYDDKKYSELDIKEFMVDKLTEIIKVKERCFQLENITDFLLKFDKQDKDVYILQNIYNMKANDYTKVKEQLEKSTQDTINIYILALQNHQHYERKFLGIDKKIVFEPLPENFLKLLRKIQRKKR